MRFARVTLLLALLLPAATRAHAQLTVRLTKVPAETPAGATVYVAGSFNGWTPGDTSYRMVPVPGGGYVITLPASVRGGIEFKFTLGSWESVELAAGGAARGNRQVSIPADGAVAIDATVERWSDPRATVTKRSTASPSVTVLDTAFAIPQLGRTRRVWLYLPPGYATSRARYPVLYLQDGQNLFDAAIGFAGEWGVDETLDSLHALGDPGVIVVGVDNGGPRRLDEYNPWKNADARYGGGEGDAYVEFLVHSLKPYVDAHYRTRPAAATTGIGGSSAGALIALYAALKHPEVFGRAALFSTASWLSGPPLFAFARAHASARPAPRLYFMSGAFETASGDLARDQNRMVDSLRAGGFPRSSIRAVVAADGRHAEWFWRRELPAAYRWLFAGDQPAPRR
jgi:metallo-beta-lactamase class B